MKKFNSKLIVPGAMAVLALSYSCKDYLNRTPTGSLNTIILANKAGVDGLLIGAYSLLDGTYGGQPGNTWMTGTDNWIYGSVAADDAHKGSTPDDQADAGKIEAYIATSGNGYLDPKWRVMFNGVQRANDVLRELPLVKDGSVSAAYAKEVTAEAKFLRAFYEFDLAKLWQYVPYADETITYDNGNYNIGNPTQVWDKIEADLTAAMADLPATQAEKGRVNKYAAEAFLAKAYMFDHKYDKALAALNDLIANGVTSSGAKYALVHYADNFNAQTKNNSEGVFVIQASVHDGSNGDNGSSGGTLNFPSAGPATCCGFFQPSFSFANAFKVDATTGLPLLDTYNDSDIKNDQNIAADKPFTPYTGTLDPRLDWSVGRRGIPYLDWGVMPGASWARDQTDGGPYVPIKNTYYQAAQASTSETYEGWAPNQSVANGYNAIRFADVLLWAAECEIEIGSLDKAQNYVNMVRDRAADPTGWVHTYKDDSKPLGGFTDVPAANYKVGYYGTYAAAAHGGKQNPTMSFALQGKDFARKAVQFERRIELGMEGHRFFDLQRWDGRFGGPMGAGFMANVLNSYLNHEIHVPNFPSALLNSAHFVQGKSEVFPVPISQINLTNGAIKQNAGYN
ncbi:RagB/SusD family nutrient uptake outer membrane protein [Mucilaginibacter sp. L3T2-6]|uniref:RagB/SusD family nutrient uptake outer membrane protein n=1 Tax=Mucilaginibacter sp. L3T2-6 TaxID=3062491 RepID=UPI0026765ED1|nr:RagB/SusD family nutrient uptake outer membrane protein [Mucilaginibacter sp. L3T2-6]MDO3642549.1 RagB/SusD family nutrient uptake outer membrane protein [Mucilaginibacter sp. L3T2-6]MDV6215055.1 RagB/SusD family nutrient uptake outer membrane protein [Mucilaginibacter sp. L3T2-6]